MANERDFVMDEDRAAIENWAAGYPDVMISFREAGEFTIRRLREGAGAKPHKILDKTIKPGEGAKGQAVSDFLSSLPGETAERILGLTGVWNGDEIVGVYLTAIGEMTMKANGFPVEYRYGLYGICQPYFPLGKEEERQALADFGAGCHETWPGLGAYYFARCFFAGDYDLHDLYEHGTPVEYGQDRESLRVLQEDLLRARRRQLSERYGEDVVSQETLDALTERCGAENVNYVLRRMQEEKEEYHTFHSVRAVGSDFQNLIDEDYQRVQHGPQSLYVKQMLEENVEFVSRVLDKQEEGFDWERLKTVYLEWSNGLVGAVTRSAFPVLAYSSRGGWAMIQDAKGFDSWGITPDPVWMCQGVEYTRYLAEQIELIMLQAALVMRMTARSDEEILAELTRMEDKLSQDIRMSLADRLPAIRQKVLREVSGH